jgi:hypothetical protein
VTRPQYIGTLALAAAGILLVGTALKPAKEAPQIVIADPELERMRQRRTIEAANEWFAETARRVRTRMVTVRETGATGVLWDANGAVLASGSQPVDSHVHVTLEGDAVGVAVVERSTPEYPLMLLRMEATQLAAPQHAPALTPGRWIVVVWPSGFLPATYGGLRQGSCGQAILATVPLVSVPSGAAAFDLSGALAGFAVRCGDHTEVLPVQELERFVERAGSVEGRILSRFGMRLDLSSMRVLEVWEGTPADRAGLLPGDMIAAVVGGDLQQLALPAAQSTFELQIERNQRTRVVLLHAGAEADGWDLAAAGIAPGDRIVSVNGQPVANQAALTRALSPLSRAFLVVERGNRKFGVTVEK